MQGANSDAAWNDFESRLDQEFSNADFDREIKEKLTDAEASYNPAHWYDFLHSWGLHQLFKVDLIYNKIFEFAILALVLLLFIPWDQPVQGPLSANSDFISDEQANLFSTGEFNNPATDFNRSDAKVLTNSNNLNSGDSENPPSSEIIETIPTAPYLSNENLKIEPIHLLKPKINALVKSPLLQSDNFNIYNQNVSADLASENIPLKNTEFLQPGNINPLYFNVDPENFVVKKINTAMAAPPSDSDGDLVFQKILSSFTTVDINTIHTPFDKVYHQRGYEQTKFGFGGGITLGFHHNRWTVEGGMVFSMKQYNPRKVLEIFRFNSADESARAVSLRSIELNTLNIPLDIRYDLARSDKKLIPYVKLGVGLNLATHANYQREEYKFLLALMLPGDAEINLQEEPRLNEKKFTDGLLQGGSFQENHYLSLNTGLGLDYSLSKQWRLFTQVGYNFNALEKKLGPNEDHINTLSLQLGFRHLPSLN